MDHFERVKLAAFSEETLDIQKEAAIGTFLGGGMTALRGLGQVARQGFKQQGLKGAWGGVREAVKGSVTDPTRSKALLGAGTILGGGALGAYGAKKAIVG